MQNINAEVDSVIGSQSSEIHENNRIIASAKTSDFLGQECSRYNVISGMRSIKQILDIAATAPVNVY